MPGIDYTHQHLSTSIMKVGEEHTPIDPSGGGGVSVDNGVDAPAEITTLVAPGAMVDGDVATLVNQQLLSATIAFDTAGGIYGGEGTMTLAEGATIPVIDIPAGAVVVRQWAQATVAFNGGTTSVQLIAAPRLTSTSASVICQWFVNTTGTGGGGAFQRADEDTTNPGVPRVLRAIADCRICVSLTDGTPTAGEAVVYALIAVPA